MPRIHLPETHSTKTRKVLFFWFLFAVAGIIISFFAIQLAAKNDFGGFFAFAIYLIFLFSAIFAFRDAKQIKSKTQNQDEDETDVELDSKWIHRPILAKFSTKDFGLFVFLPITIPIFVLAYLFGANSPVVVTIAIIMGILGTCVFLIIQNLRD